MKFQLRKIAEDIKRRHVKAPETYEDKETYVKEYSLDRFIAGRMKGEGTLSEEDGIIAQLYPF